MEWATFWSAFIGGIAGNILGIILWFLTTIKKDAILKHKMDEDCRRIANDINEITSKLEKTNIKRTDV